MPVKKGDNVKVEYTGTLDDGVVFDTTEGREPLMFEVGAGQVILGFEDAVLGMEEGEEKEFTLNPSEAYGDHNPQLIQDAPKGRLPDGVEPGMLLLASLENGAEMPVRVMDIKDETVTVDLNHPLAGKKLNFKIKLAGVSA